MYQEDPIWEDIIPLPQDDGDQPLAQISYTEEYAEAMSYLRALMAKDEISERALSITEHITEMNPAHYTVWLYRAKVIFSLQSASLRSEIEFLNGKALRHNKSYQIWHHRQMVVDRLGDPSGESEFIAKILEKDEKNYHVWSYRQWLVKRFALWADQYGELAFVEKLLDNDVRNNSAWSHRWFFVMGQLKDGEAVSREIVDREIAFTEEAVLVAPMNPSPWNYLRGLLRRTNLPLSTIEKLCIHYAPLETPDKIISSHALETLAEILAEQGDFVKATEALDLLADKFDPIRRGYWYYRKRVLGSKAELVAEGNDQDKIPENKQENAQAVR